MSEVLGGLAGRIRAAETSDEYDLAGYTKDKCSELVRDAFSEPLAITFMVRLSFIVGGGKQVRQKYGDDLPRDFCSALSSLGYEEDKAAACDHASAGTYKRQHDTSKNLLFVHVFPNVTTLDGDTDSEDEDDSCDESDPIERLIRCELDEFEELLGTHVRAYTQLRRLLDELKPRVSLLEEAERKLIARETLEAKEQTLYDQISLDDLQKKVQITNASLQATVEAGHLNCLERAQVLEQLVGKAKTLEEELKKAASEGKVKLQQRLEEQKTKLRQMRETVSSAAEYVAPLQRGLEIKSLRGKLTAIQHIEKKAAGQRTADDQRRLADKKELTQAVAFLENEERMWFETEEEFRPRLQKCINEIKISELKRLAETPAKPDAPRGGQPAPKPRGKTKWGKVDIFANAAAIDAGRSVAPLGELIPSKSTGDDDDGAPVESRAVAKRQPAAETASKKKDKRRFMKLDPRDFFGEEHNDGNEGTGVDTAIGGYETLAPVAQLEGNASPEEVEAREIAREAAAARRAEKAEKAAAEKAEKAAAKPPQAPPQKRTKPKFKKVDASEFFCAQADDTQAESAVTVVEHRARATTEKAGDSNAENAPPENVPPAIVRPEEDEETKLEKERQREAAAARRAEKAMKPAQAPPPKRVKPKFAKVSIDYKFD